MNNRNPLATQTIAEKRKQYDTDCRRNAMAYTQSCMHVPLRNVKFENVEFIGGLWRIQHTNNFDIIQVRDCKMILGERLAHHEKTFFEYYTAALVGYNCYGPIRTPFDMVVAKYTTDAGTYWSYGKNIAEARAYMGIRLYDQYQELINNIACKKIKQNTK